MMELSFSNNDYFLSRFSNFFDGIVRKVDIYFDAQSGERRVIMIISVQDQESRQDNGWSNISLEVQGVEEFILIESNSSCSVLSDGVNIGFFEQLIYLDFCPYTEAAGTIEDFKKSRFLVAGRCCNWKVSPYSEILAN